MIRYAITNLQGYGNGREAAQEALLQRMRRWLAEGMEYVQLREKHLEAGELFGLAEKLVRMADGSSTRVLVNSRADVAVAAGAQGVHLSARDGELRPDQVRQIFAKAKRADAIVSVSCHTVVEVERAVGAGVNVILFGPVFEKRVGAALVLEGVGLGVLREAVAAAGSVPVLALGGISGQQIRPCLEAGASGVAAIRLFA